MAQARAALAIAHKLLLCIFRMFAERETYREMGADDLDKLDIERSADRLVRRLEGLGFSATVQPGPAPAPL